MSQCGLDELQVREDCRRRAREQRDIWLTRYRAAKDVAKEKVVTL